MDLWYISDRGRKDRLQLHLYHTDNISRIFHIHSVCCKRKTVENVLGKTVLQEVHRQTEEIQTYLSKPFLLSTSVKAKQPRNCIYRNFLEFKIVDLIFYDECTYFIYLKRLFWVFQKSNIGFLFCC